MQKAPSHQRKFSGTDEEEERGNQYDNNNTYSAYHGLTDRVMEDAAAIRDEVSTTNRIPRFVSHNRFGNNTTPSFQLNQRPGTGSSVNSSSNRGRKRRSGVALLASSGGLYFPSSPAEAPLSLMSLLDPPSSSLMMESVAGKPSTTAKSAAVQENTRKDEMNSLVPLFPSPSVLLTESVVSPSDTPSYATASTSTAAFQERTKDDEDDKKDPAVTHLRSFSECVVQQLYPPESPGDVLGALSSLALQSPRPSPFSYEHPPPPKVFSHQVLSSPFLLSSSSRRTAQNPQPLSLVSPTIMGGVSVSEASILEAPASATPPSAFCGLRIHIDYASSSFHEATPPAKTAPLTFITHHHHLTPMDRKRSPVSFLPCEPFKSSLAEGKTSSELDKDALDRTMASPNVVPLPLFALNPRSACGNSGSALRSFSSFGLSPQGRHSSPRHRTEQATTASECPIATTLSSRSGSNTHQATEGRAWPPATSSERLMMLPPPDKPRSVTNKPSTPVGENSCTPLTNSDVSFIPLPDWDGSVESSVERTRQQHKARSLPPLSQPLRAFSLLHTPADHPDPIGHIIMSSTRGNNEGGSIHPKDSSNESMFLDNESLSDDDQDDNDLFWLAVPREIEEERQQRNVISTSMSRPYKHPRYGSRHSNNNNNNHEEEEEEEESSYEHDDGELHLSERTDQLRCLPQIMKPPSPMPPSRGVDPRDLVTPHAIMPKNGSPPPLVMMRAECH